MHDVTIRRRHQDNNKDSQDSSEHLQQLHPVLRRVYQARDIQRAEQLDSSAARLLPFQTLKGMEQACALLYRHAQAGNSILIVGDFDADGATSTAVAIRALHLMGIDNVGFLVPNRFEFGYGLTPEIVEVARERDPQLIITVDTGISSINGVKRARQLGIDVLITDHHLPAAKLPEANAIINPNQPGDTFASKALAGVGVIFYLMLALRSYLRRQHWFEQNHLQEPNLAELLDLVALGTVADVVPLDHNNRILVAQGLARIRQGRCCAGINALLQVAKRSARRLIAQDMGFALGPRLNAAGRLEDMSLGIECLLTDDAQKALDLAQELDNLNYQRRDIEQSMQQDAMAILEELFAQQQEFPLGVCLYQQQWHQGVIGILASRVKDRLHRPVIVFADGDDGQVKGSARSISGVHIRDVLDAIASRYPGLITKFGGHAMAAGLTLERKNLDAFRLAFDEEVARHVGDDELGRVILSDGELQAQDLDLPLAQLLREAGPWGQAFPEPVFDGEFELIAHRVVGEKHLKMTLRHPQRKMAIDAIAFNQSAQDWPPQVTKVLVAYKLDVNEFRGESNAQLLVEYVQPLET